MNRGKIFKIVTPFSKALGVFRLLLCAQMATARKQKEESKKREGPWRRERERERNVINERKSKKML